MLDIFIKERTLCVFEIEIVTFAVRTYMDSDITLETAAILFSSEPLSKQGISSEYVMADVICIG